MLTELQTFSKRTTLRYLAVLYEHAPLHTLHLLDIHARTIGPFFVAFPNLREALVNNVAIRTKARACTILPNFVGCVGPLIHSCWLYEVLEHE